MFRFNNSPHCVWYTFTRQICSGAVLKSSVQKQAKVMAKIMNGSSRKKRNWSTNDLAANVSISPVAKDFQKGSQTKRRVDVLNKLFMRSITDVIATGEVVPELTGRGICITKVKVTSDYSAVNIYWTAKGTLHDAELDKILEKSGFDLRHHLCQMHVLGKVPKICFVADKSQIILEDTLQCLEKAKSTDGYESEDIAQKLKSEYVLRMPLDSETLARIKGLEENMEDMEDLLPPMTHNVLGLDHATIMKKVEMAVEKSEARHRLSSSDTLPSGSMDFCRDVTVKESINVERSKIVEFIAKQKIQKKKIQKALNKKFYEDMELCSRSEENEEYIDVEDGDFIEEFENKVMNAGELREK